jgi:hypothetical protein
MSKVLSEQDAILEGLNDYSDQLWDSIEPGLVAMIAAQEPAWMREARREEAEFGGIDWAYEDWKWEREFAKAEAEYEEAMTRLDDDGAPINSDWRVWI